VSVALDIQHAMRMRRIAICSMSGSIIFLLIISQTARFSENVFENKMYLDFLYNFCLKHFSF